VALPTTGNRAAERAADPGSFAMVGNGHLAQTTGAIARTKNF
jgi:hypothetical protein